MKVLFATMIKSLIKNILFKHVYAMVVIKYCKEVLYFNDVVIVYVGKNGYRIHFWDMSKNKAMIFAKNDLSEKNGLL